MSGPRRLRFRAWHSTRGEWLHEEGCDILGETIWAFGEWCRVSIEELNDVAVEQYTGLDDRDGKPVYEGDIVQTLFRGHPDTGVVEWGTYGDGEYVS